MDNKMLVICVAALLFGGLLGLLVPGNLKTINLTEGEKQSIISQQKRECNSILKEQKNLTSECSERNRKLWDENDKLWDNYEKQNKLIVSSASDLNETINKVSKDLNKAISDLNCKAK